MKLKFSVVFWGGGGFCSFLLICLFRRSTTQLCWSSVSRTWPIRVVHLHKEPYKSSQVSVKCLQVINCCGLWAKLSRVHRDETGIKCAAFLFFLSKMTVLFISSLAISFIALPSYCKCPLILLYAHNQNDGISSSIWLAGDCKKLWFFWAEREALSCSQHPDRSPQPTWWLDLGQ